MRQLPLMAVAMLAGCTSSAPIPSNWPPPVPALTALGLPPDYEDCLQRRSRATPDMYATYLLCRIHLTGYVVQLSLTQEEKTRRLEQLEPVALTRAQEVAVSFHGAPAVRQAMHQEPPATPAQLPSPAWNACAGGEMRAMDIMTGPIGAIGEVVAARCRSLYSGPAGADIDIVVRAVEKLRARSTESAPVVIEQKPDRGDLRF